MKDLDEELTKRPDRRAKEATLRKERWAVLGVVVLLLGAVAAPQAFLRHAQMKSDALPNDGLPLKPSQADEFRGIALQLRSGDPQVPFEKYLQEIATTGANTVCLSPGGYQENAASSSLFIEQRIPPHLNAEETIARIHEQNGLVFIPHPLARGVPGRIEERKLHEIIDQVHLIEGYNARAPLATDDRRAREFAAQHGLPVTAGSDGHFACEIGRAWTELDDFRTPNEFLANLRRARLHYTSKTPYLVPALTVVAMIPALGVWRVLRKLWRRGSNGRP